MEISERARRYVAFAEPAVAGSDGHSATFKVAMTLVHGFELPAELARAILGEYNERCSPPWEDKDLDYKIASAQKATPREGSGWMLKGGYTARDRAVDSGVAAPPTHPAQKGPKRPPFQLQKLENAVVGVPEGIDYRFFEDRSQIDPLDAEGKVRDGEDVAAVFLSALYEPEEKVLIFENFYSQGQYGWAKSSFWRLGAKKGIRGVASKLPRSGRDGMWYLCNPVDGEWEHFGQNDDGTDKWSRRSGLSVTSWRYFLMESDEKGIEALWLRLVAVLPLPIVAVYTSGGKSVHALIKLDAAGQLAWEAQKDILVKMLCPLGADGGAMSGVRLTRLPGIWRGDSLQRLIYLNPDADGCPIIDQKKIHG